MLNRKVYIIDYEIISPIANGADNIISSIRSNFNADRSIQQFDTSGIPFKNAAEIREDLSHFYKNESDLVKSICSYDRMFELIVACFGLAEPRIKELIERIDPGKTGVILGIGADVTQLEIFEKQLQRFLTDDNNALLELFIQLNDNKSKMNRVNNPYDIYSLYLAKKFQASAYQQSILTACVSSTQAIALAFDSIKTGETDVVIAGGTDSIVNSLATIAFGKLGVIPETKDNASCKPFDINRNGTLAGECAGFAILVSSDFLEKNALTPTAELLGYGNTLDAYKITAPDPDGTSITAAIKQALDNSGLTTEKIDYINAHGTGTKQNDYLELMCIKKAFGDVANQIPISSTKSRHGHAIAAAGIQEFCMVMESMKNSFIPANLNLISPCDVEMNLVRENYSKKIDYALTNNFAFGGINTVLTIKNEM